MGGRLSDHLGTGRSGRRRIRRLAGALTQEQTPC